MKEYNATDEPGPFSSTLIKHMAEEKGYRAIIEQPTPDGSGKVDVGLDYNGKKIACEIALTTTVEHELKNQKHNNA